MATTDPLPRLTELGTVHFIAIGGAGMSVVAQLLLDRGVRVQGSDARDGVAVQRLAAQGVATWIGHDAAHVAGADTVVISSAIAQENVELVAARGQGSRVLHRSEALAIAMRDQLSVAVAGAHGKTTTSAMIAVLLRELGMDPSFAIGGSVQTPDGPVSGGHAGAGGIVVAEADESDGSFLNYSPQIAVVTNVEPDHLDHYASAAAVDEVFARFAGRVLPGGVLIACGDDAGARRLAERESESVTVLTYGTAAGNDVRLSDIQLGQGTESGIVATATLEVPAVRSVGAPLGRRQEGRPGDPGSTMTPPAKVSLRLSVPGEHNLRNGAAAVLTAVLLGADPQAAAAALSTFQGTGRRFDLRGEVSGIRVIDDYAHHPTEIAALVAGARSVAAGGRILVLFQPHLYSRTRIFAQEFARVLDAADLAVVCDVYGARELPDPAVGPRTITAHATDPGRLWAVGDRDQAAIQLADLARPGDVLLVVGAGDVTQAATVILDRLAARSAAR